MEFSKKESAWLGEVGRCHHTRRDGDAGPAQRADGIRRMMTLLQAAMVNKWSSPSATSLLYGQQMAQYDELTSQPEEQGGLNNYTAQSLALMQGRKYDSKQWKSSLAEKPLGSIPAVQRYMQLAKAAKESVIPAGFETKELPSLTVKRNDHSKVGNSTQTRGPGGDTGMNSTQTRAPAGNTSMKKGGPPSGSGASYSGPSASSGAWTTNSTPLFSNGRNNSGPSFGGDRTNPMFNRGDQASSTAGPGGNPGNSLHHRDFYHLGAMATSQQPAGPTRAPFPHSTTAAVSMGGIQPSEPESDWNFRPKRADPAFSNTWQNQASAGFSRTGNEAFQQACTGRGRRDGSNSSFRNEATKRPFGQVDNEDEDDSPAAPAFSAFRTAKSQLVIEQQKKYGKGRGGGQISSRGGGQMSSNNYGSNKRSLGTRRGPSSKFVPPVMNRDQGDDGTSLVRRVGGSLYGGGGDGSHGNDEEMMDERLKAIEPKMVELIRNEIMDHGPPITWDEIAGLEFAKTTIKEIVVWPMLRPDIFTGLRGPPKGLLLFGPPGTGKTLIGKCIACQSKSTFFSISASSLTSKWVGEGEKMVRALFAVARVEQPAVIFIDEIDSLLSQRTDGEHEASRRIKTEFLVQLDGATTGSEERILVVGATNRPQEIDEAARRRFVKRLYIPLPEAEARQKIIVNLLREQRYQLNQQQLTDVCQRSQGFSGADVSSLCREAALGPIRCISLDDIENITPDQVRPILYQDFLDALDHVRASVSPKDLDVYLEWNRQYGSGGHAPS